MKARCNASKKVLFFLKAFHCIPDGSTNRICAEDFKLFTSSWLSCGWKLDSPFLSVSQMSWGNAWRALDYDCSCCQPDRNGELWTAPHQLSTPLPLCSRTKTLSRLDYCNPLLSGCPQYLLNRLQKVRNNADRFILKAPQTDHSTPHLRTLHWLPIDARIKCKLCSLCFGAITSNGPVYLSDLFKIDTPARQLRFSADIDILCIPSVNTKSYVNAFSLTPFHHSGTHFQKTSDFLGHFLPLDQHSRSTLFQ